MCGRAAVVHARSTLGPGSGYLTAEILNHGEDQSSLLSFLYAFVEGGEGMLLNYVNCWKSRVCSHTVSII